MNLEEYNVGARQSVSRVEDCSEELEAEKTGKASTRGGMAKWEEEKQPLVKMAKNINGKAFNNAINQLTLLSPNLIVERISSDYKIFKGQLCKINIEKKVYIVVVTGEEIGLYVEKDA
ncbi:hypothetical protein SESBI_21836 [Sesbania bispinosa]|nr:hypothetical protein SESBI_21836 [Sesbania bispinosa]